MPQEVERWIERGATRELLPNGWKCSYALCTEQPFDEELDALACERWHIALQIQALKAQGQHAEAEQMITLARRWDDQRPDVLARLRRNNCARMFALIQPLVAQAAEMGVIFSKKERAQIDHALEIFQRGVAEDPTLDPAEPPQYYQLVDKLLRREIARHRQIIDTTGGTQ